MARSSAGACKAQPGLARLWTSKTVLGKRIRKFKVSRNPRKCNTLVSKSMVLGKRRHGVWITLTKPPQYGAEIAPKSFRLEVGQESGKKTQIKLKMNASCDNIQNPVDAEELLFFGFFKSSQLIDADFANHRF